MINIILDKLSKKFELDMKYFFKAGLFTNIRLLFDFALGFLLTYLITQNYSKEEVGIYFLALSIYGIFGIFTFPGFLHSATSGFIEKKFSVYEKSLKIMSIGILIGLIASILTAIFAFYYYNSIYKFLLLTFFFITPVSLKLYLRYLYSKDKFELMTILVLLEKLAYILPSIAMILLGYDLFIVLFAYSISYFIFTLVLCIHYLFKIKRKENCDGEFPELSKEGFKFSFIETFLTIAAHTDKILISYLLGVSQLAIYSIALLIPKKINVIIDKLANQLFFKKTKNLKRSNLHKLLIKKAFYILGFMILIISILWVSIPYIYKFFFPDYENSIFLAQILSLIIALQLLIRLNTNYLQSNLMSNQLFKIEFATSIIQILLYIILIPIYGLNGAVFSLFLSYLIKAMALLIK